MSRKIGVVLGAALAAIGCDHNVGGPEPQSAVDEEIVNGITYRANTRLVVDSLGRRVQFTVTASNDRDEAITIGFGGCPVRAVAHRTAARSGPPAWESASSEDVCRSFLEFRTLEPNAMREFSASYPTNAILGGKLPAARYYFTAILKLDIETVVLKAGDLDLTH